MKINNKRTYYANKENTVDAFLRHAFLLLARGGWEVTQSVHLSQSDNCVRGELVLEVYRQTRL